MIDAEMIYSELKAIYPNPKIGVCGKIANELSKRSLGLDEFITALGKYQDESDYCPTWRKLRQYLPRRDKAVGELFFFGIRITDPAIYDDLVCLYYWKGGRFTRNPWTHLQQKYNLPTETYYNEFAKKEMTRVIPGSRLIACGELLIEAATSVEDELRANEIYTTLAKRAEIIKEPIKLKPKNTLLNKIPRPVNKNTERNRQVTALVDTDQTLGEKDWKPPPTPAISDEIPF